MLRQLIIFTLALTTVFGFAACNGGGTQEALFTEEPPQALTPLPKPTVVPTSTSYIPEGFAENYVFSTLAPLNPEITEPMFDEDYYLVLPGDGPQYFVYDGMGNVVAEFTHVGEFLWEGMGLYHRDTIVENFSLKKMDYVFGMEYSRIFEINGLNFIESYDYDTDKHTIAAADSNHNYMFTYEYESSISPFCGGVFPYRGNYLMFTKGHNSGTGEEKFSMSPRIVDKRGNLIRKLDEEKFAGIVGVLGDEYIITKNDYQPEDELYESLQCDIRNQNGEIVLENVTALISKRINMDEEVVMPSIYCDYIVYDGYCYDSSLNKLSPITEGDEHWEKARMCGNFINMYPYEVDDIVCYADYEGFAYGSEGNRYAILSDWGEFVVTLPYEDLGVYYVSPNTAIFGDGETSYLVLLETGEIVYETTERLEGTDSDISVIKNEDKWITVDKNGVENVLCANLLRQVTYNGLVLISRGAYIGLATPDGEWLFRIVSPDVAADQENFYEWGWDG